MTIEKAIQLFEDSRCMTREHQEAVNLAIDCMKFARDFLPLKASPERMEHALHLLNAMEYIAKKR